jgi:hypothetical protein
MIMRTKTPKGPFWAGRIAVLGVAALTLPLAPSRAQKSETEQPTLEQRESLRKRAEAAGSDDRQTRAIRQQFAIENLAHIRKELLEVQSQKRKAQALIKAQKQVEPTEAEINQSIDQDPVIAKLAEDEERLNAESSRSRALARSGADPALAALKQRIGASRKSLASKRAALRPNTIKQLQNQNKNRKIEQELAMLDDLENRLTEEIKSLGKENRALAVDMLARKEIQDGDKKKDDDDKEEKVRDAAERFQEQLQDLISKLGKELSPVTEEVRKALERAVGEIHQSLEKEGLSAEGFGMALERSQEELRKAFEGGGAVDKEVREAIDRARKDMQDAYDRTKGDVQDQVDSLRQQSRTLRDQARENFDRARGEAERRLSRDGDEQPNSDELESARKEIRELQQQLQRATRRLDELQRRGPRRNAVRRREPNPQAEPQPRNPETPGAKPAPPEPPKEPAVPATPAPPARPNVRRPLPPTRPVPGAGRRGPQIENDKRLHELEDKMDQLLKELKNLKEEKSPKESN